MSDIDATTADRVNPGDLLAFGTGWRTVAEINPTRIATEDGARYDMLHITFTGGAGLLRHPSEPVTIYRLGMIVCGPQRRPSGVDR